jgi:hypothetical protein
MNRITALCGKKVKYNNLSEAKHRTSFFLKSTELGPVAVSENQKPTNFSLNNIFE